MIETRLNQLIKHFTGGNKRAFAINIGVSASVIENIVGKRKGKPSCDVLEKIICAMEDVNARWLLTGKGDMLKNEAVSNTPKITHKSSLKDTNKIKRLEDKIRILEASNTSGVSLPQPIQSNNKPLQTEYTPQTPTESTNTIKFLRETIVSKDETIKSKDETIKSKDETIKGNNKTIDVLERENRRLEIEAKKKDAQRGEVVKCADVG